MSNRRTKMGKLSDILRDMGSVLVAFSGGVDSSFLLAAAVRTLGDRAVAATAQSELYPEDELRQACAMTEKLGARHIVFESDELKAPDLADNPPNRCYYCKKELFSRLREIARQEDLSSGISHMFCLGLPISPVKATSHFGRRCMLSTSREVVVNSLSPSCGSCALHDVEQ